MKKKINKPMRAAGILLVATMLTTCMTAGTFAKYTTSDSATDTARVAKFGVNVSVNGSLFGEEYGIGDNSITGYNANTANIPIDHSGIYPNVGTGSVQVLTKGQGANANNVVAPGTENNSGMGFSVKGKPEVDCTVDIEIESKNVYLKKGDYAVMQTVLFATEDEFKHAVAVGNIYLYDDEEWKLQDANSTYDADNVYCIKKNVVSANDDFGDLNYYYPVQYSAADTRTTGSAGSPLIADPITTDATQDSLSTIVDTMFGLANDSNTNSNDDSVIGYRKASFKTWIQQANREFDTDFPQMVLTWKWDYENSTAATKEKYDKFDTILGDLVAQDGGDLAGLEADTVFVKVPTVPANTSVSVCTVVIKDGDNYVLPTAAGKADANGTTDHIGALTSEGNYNLETAVYLKATVTQVD